MKFLIAGFGSIGRRHFRNLPELGEEDILFLRSHKSTLEDSELEGFTVETEVEAALARLQEGVYGKCTQCGRDIHPARLESIPTTSMCFQCKAAE